MITTTYHRNGILVWKKDETEEQYRARIGGEKPIDQMTRDEVLAAQVEERRRRQVVSGCCGQGA